MDVLKQQILPYLKTNFEKSLFEAALYNLNEADNKLRLNNFAYAVRELTRHFLERLAPDEEVWSAPWFKPNDPDNPKKITRAQRIKYAIQGYLSDDFTKNVLLINLTEVSDNLKTSIDDLSKYTHVNPDTFDSGADAIEELSFNVMMDTLTFFMTVNETQVQVMNAVDDCINEEMVSQFYYNVRNEIDMLATHHEVLNYMVTEIKPINKDDITTLKFEIGAVHNSLAFIWRHF